MQKMTSEQKKIMDAFRKSDLPDHYCSAYENMLTFSMNFVCYCPIPGLILRDIEFLTDHSNPDLFGIRKIKVSYKSMGLTNENPVDMQTWLTDMEEKLLNEGFPFASDYTFHGKLVSDKECQNKDNRREWGV